jgi:hypothetical protein
MKGTISGSTTRIAFTLSPKARVVIEGFDPATGRTKWTFDGGRDQGLISQTALPARASEATVAIHDARRRLVLLDLTSGSVTSLQAGITFWCNKILTYKDDVGYPDRNGQTITNYVGQFATFPCDPSGRVRPVPSSVPSFAGNSGTADGLAAWSQKTGVFTAPAQGT